VSRAKDWLASLALFSFFISGMGFLGCMAHAWNRDGIFEPTLFWMWIGGIGMSILYGAILLILWLVTRVKEDDGEQN
jgi:hypothetical protein